MKALSRLLAGTALAAGFLGWAPTTLADSPPPAHRFQFVRLHARNLKKSIAFYTQVLGLHEVSRLAPPAVPATEVFFASDDPRGSLIDLEERTKAAVLVSAEPNAGSAEFCFEVPDVTAALKKSQAQGLEVVMPGGHVVWSEGTFDWAVVDDPDGNHIEFIHDYPRAAKGAK